MAVAEGCLSSVAQGRKASGLEISSRRSRGSDRRLGSQPRLRNHGCVPASATTHLVELVVSSGEQGTRPSLRSGLRRGNLQRQSQLCTDRRYGAPARRAVGRSGYGLGILGQALKG